ncbi:SirB2 family protein [Roseateles sp. DAIF2]|uniref:SirB2 family protein n=1 Tax=Roseateles sp. DAIF2 TaxID=2714952 RepID=UPI0018A2F90F|nr:SirB2 family protein [Roseateles sp. DAIF2]QPF74835.1 SirB2 family protein [Roseateles sp. DAIF2]
MDWFYTQMLELHRILAWCSVLMFSVRGLAFQAGATGWATDSRGGLIAFAINLLMVVSGLSLWVLLHFDPLRDDWLLAKLIAVCGYGACAHWSMREDRISLPVYLAALLLLAYVMAISYTRAPLLGL